MFSRRQFLQQIGGGFGLAGLQGTLQAETVRQPHFAPKAKHVIFLFLNGGMSQVDTFDPKPALTRHDGSLCLDRKSVRTGQAARSCVRRGSSGRMASLGSKSVKFS